jgi:hypothetical protein
MKSFFESIGSWLKSHFKSMPSFEVQASSALNYCVPAIEAIDELVDPGLAVIVNPILDKIKTGFAAAAVTIKSASTASGSANLKSIFASILANLPALEAAMQIKDAATQAKLSAAVTLINGEITAMQTQLPAVTA